MIYRKSILLREEIRELLTADIVLTFAFSLVMIGGIYNIGMLWPVFLYFVPISFVAVSLTFILHELMHKFVAEHYGAIAAFKTSMGGLGVTIITSFFGFLIGIPGATMISTNNFTRKEEGIVSIAGPLTNFAIFVVFFAIGILSYHNFVGGVTSTLGSGFVHNTYLHNLINFTLFISILLAFFNMLPIYPLDGSKVLRWNKGIYILAMVIIFGLFALVIPVLQLIFGLIIMLGFALAISLFYRGFVI
ncbi:MAG: site-2 protease family protein [Candidatus Micrarchaeia archaeon]